MSMLERLQEPRVGNAARAAAWEAARLLGLSWGLSPADVQESTGRRVAGLQRVHSKGARDDQQLARKHFLQGQVLSIWLCMHEGTCSKAVCCSSQDGRSC